MWIWDCGGFLSCLFPSLVKLWSTAGTQGRHCWEGWFKVFLTWWLAPFGKPETGSPCLVFIWGTERKSLLDFLLPCFCREHNSAWSHGGKGNNAKFQPNFWASSLPVAKKWQRVLSPGHWRDLCLWEGEAVRDLGIHSWGKQNGREYLIFCWCLGQEESAKAKIHPWVITIS